MIKKIVMTIDFIKARKSATKIVKDMTMSLYQNKDFASTIKKRIRGSENYRGDTLSPLRKSTRNIRKMRGISGTKPLIETGKLLNSIKNVKKKNKVGVSMMEYGMHQAKGFVTNNHFAVKKGNEVVGFRDYSGGVKVPSRPFVYPLTGQIKKTQTSTDVFAGMVDVNKKDATRVIKKLKKALRHRKVYRTKWQ